MSTAEYQAPSSLLVSFFELPRQTFAHPRRLLCGLPDSLSFSLEDVALMPTFPARCSIVARAGEDPFVGLSLAFSLAGLTLGDIDGPGEVGGLLMPSREPSLKRLCWWVEGLPL